MKKTWKILVVDDDISILRSYQKYLESEGYSVLTAKDGLEAREVIFQNRPDMVLLDINMPKKTGLELLEELNCQMGSDMPLIIMLTAYGDLEAAVKATSLGAYDFLTKPVPLEKLRLTVKRGLEKINFTEHVALIIDNESEKYRNSIVGRAPKMIDIYKAISSLQGNKATVLISGESGTGKEMVAKAVHETTSPKDPFIAINCAAIPENLIESELMGYVKGAFTGAATKKEGKLEAVGNGTLLLDEISETPLDFQAKLLRVLQEREYYPVGGTEKKSFLGRIVALTNRNLNELVEKGIFREDLFYRLNVININVPPLREHPEDIDLLIIHFMRKVNHLMNTKIESITREAVDLIRTHNWPGNVRELENVITKAAINTKNSILTKDCFSFLNTEGNISAFTNDSSELSFPEMVPLKEIEKIYIHRVLHQTGWHKGRSAEILGITRPTLDKRIEEFGLKKDV